MSNLLKCTEKKILSDHVHPFEELLTLSPHDVLDKFKKLQQDEFRKVICSLSEPDNGLMRFFNNIKNQSKGLDCGEFKNLLIYRAADFEEIMLELHEHVMSHPVWLHPCLLYTSDAADD